MTFGGHIGYLWPKWSEGGNDATRDTNKLYAQQKAFDYHFYQYTRPNGCLRPVFD